MLLSVLPATGIYVERSTPSPGVAFCRGIVYCCFVLYLCRLSTYDIVITTYSLVAKEIPTKKHEGEVPGAELSIEVRRGEGKGGRAGATCPLM